MSSPITVVSLQPSLFVIQLAIGPGDDDDDDDNGFAEEYNGINDNHDMKDGDGASDDNNNNVHGDSEYYEDDCRKNPYYKEDDERAPLANVTPMTMLTTVIL